MPKKEARAPEDRIEKLFEALSAKYANDPLGFFHAWMAATKRETNAAPSPSRRDLLKELLLAADDAVDELDSQCSVFKAARLRNALEAYRKACE